MNKKAFFLLSFSVYLGCITLLFSLILPFLFQCHQSIAVVINKINQTQKIEATLWNIKRILENAPGDITSFKNLEKDMIVWSEKKRDYGLIYTVKNNSIYSIAGIFNEHTKKWEHGKKRLIGEATVAFSYNTSPFYLTCSIQEISCVQRIYPRKRFYTDTTL